MARRQRRATGEELKGLAFGVILIFCIVVIAMFMNSCRATQDAASTLKITHGVSDFERGDAERTWVALSIQPFYGIRSPDRVEIVPNGPDPLDFGVPTIPFIMPSPEEMRKPPEEGWWRTSGGMVTVLGAVGGLLGLLGFGARRHLKKKQNDCA